MALTNMKLDAAEAKQEASIEADRPEYPYGLTVCLNDDALKKLNLQTLPTVGTRMQLQALVEVCAVRQYQEQDGKDSSIDLQITDMQLEPAPNVDAAATLYGSNGA